MKLFQLKKNLFKPLMNSRKQVFHPMMNTRFFSTSVDPSSIRVNQFNAGLCIRPHAAKVSKGGEDAASVTENFIALADGVGGWAESGVDPAKFSKQLCMNIDKRVLTDMDIESYMKEPIQLLIDAVDETRVTGSATAVIVSLDREEAFVHTANLGDSGYLLLRKNGMDLISVFRSKEMQHSFNYPHQVGTGGDDPASADKQVHEIMNNDIFIVGTDGLFDNLFDVRIIELIKPFLRGRDDLLDPTLIAEIIANEAEKFSRNAGYMSPFAKNAQSWFHDYRGGKQDDITVAVAQVKLAPKETKRTDIETPIDV